MRLRLCVAYALSGEDSLNPQMSVRAFFWGHNMSTEEIRLTAIQSVPIAIGAI